MLLTLTNKTFAKLLKNKQRGDELIPEQICIIVYDLNNLLKAPIILQTAIIT